MTLPPYAINDRISIYVKSCKDWLRPVNDTKYLSIQHLEKPRRDGEMLIVAAHLPSEREYDDEDLLDFAEESRMEIERSEHSVGHKNTIVVGDFNTNPFDDRLVSFRGFHSVMDKRIAQRGSRILRGKERCFFYNPMWSLLGDRTSGPPGTFYYNKSKSIVYFWHMLDQVLLRPDLIPFFPDNELRIITETDSDSLLSNNGIPNKSEASDHLPLLFKVAI